MIRLLPWQTRHAGELDGVPGLPRKAAGLDADNRLRLIDKRHIPDGL
jgi:hypothetical protein